MNQSPSIRLATRLTACGALAVMLWAVCCVSPAPGCSTPVFRYAMYNWAPAPYYVFYFYHGEASQQDENPNQPPDARSPADLPDNEDESATGEFDEPFRTKLPANEDEPVNRLLDGLSQADPPANVVFTAVDASKEEELKKIPKVVRETYLAKADGQKPMHVVFCPWVLYSAWMAEQYAAATQQEDAAQEEDTGAQEDTAAQEDATGPEKTTQPADATDQDGAAAETPKQSDPDAADPDAAPPADEGKTDKEEKPEEESPGFTELFAGRLDQQQVEAMIDSPARKQIGKLLEEGSAAVLLILTGPDEAANKQAEKVAGEVVALAADGEFPVSGGDEFGPDAFLPPPGDQPAQENASEDAAAEEDAGDALKLAVLKVVRTDPAEKWLVDALLSVEPDLRLSKFAKTPMVFVVYGRGRAMPPYLDKGITTDNLAECVMFLTGPCSCTVKDQNPGVDLLVRRDWDAVAETLAAEEEGFATGPYGYQEFDPDESTDDTQASAADADPDQAPPAGDPNAEADDPSPDTPPAAAQSPTGSETVQTTVVPKGSPQPGTASSAGEDSPDDHAATVDEAPADATTGSLASRNARQMGIWIALAAAVVLAAGFVMILRRPA